jgi:membrane associated rhomboid family serine protease
MTPWVLRLIIANVVVYFLAPPLSYPWFRMALSPADLLMQPWGVFTYMFLHGNFSHLLFNMLGLFFLGPRLEMQLGGRSFLALYFVSGLGGALFSFIPPLVPVVGASGAVFGVLLGFAYFWPKERIYIWMILPVPAWGLVAFLIGSSLLSGISGAGDGVAHFAHLGGLAAGYGYLRWRKRRYFRQWKPSPASRPQSVKSALRGDDRASLRRWKAIRLEDLHELNRGEVERLVEKAASSGVGSLTPDERAMLDRFSTGN